ncbi:polyphosphate kinase [Cyclobacterium qasimii]|nr:polyphosphate kinase [Cyclobacterium qasimii]EPR67269.1 Polyphosphate kinase [Cyclobacterium qasimii M12-11B]
MIDKLRHAADEGVEIDLIVRGICCYHPQTKLQEKNIKVVSIIDRFLEHTRIYHFHNDGVSKVYLASADWMTRNLSRRIEVAFPILKESAKALLLAELDAQLHDNKKGRYVACKKENQFIEGDETIGSQEKMFELVSKYNF